MRWKALILAPALAACTQTAHSKEPAADRSRANAEARIRTIAAERTVDPLAGFKVPKDRGEAEVVARALQFQSGETTDANRAFRLGAGGSDLAAQILEIILGPETSPEVLAAAAMGLGNCTSDTTEKALVGIALRTSHPPEALEALLSYYKFRAKDKGVPGSTIEATDEFAIVKAYSAHPTARGRAALCHLGRAVKDQLVTDAVLVLSSDADVEVRRAAAMALADSSAKRRDAKDRERCTARLAELSHDPEPRVVMATCNAIGTYDGLGGTEVQLLLDAANHADFNVRVAALRALGKIGASAPFETKAAVVDRMKRLARSDPSVSVRFEGGTQCAAIDAAAAQELVDDLMKDANEYVRCAACKVLSKSDDPKAIARLVEIAKTDAHVRVREEALSGLESRTDSSVAKDAVREALSGRDPVMVANACGVASANGWKDLVPTILALPPRFTGCVGADARAGAIDAISKLDGDAHEPFFERFLKDANGSVRFSAEKALAAVAKKDPPSQPSRGADLSGELLPGGAPLLDADSTLVVETTKGTMRIRLFPDAAPVHCAHVAALARNGFYDGLTWHRVEPDFVIQGGCPRGDGAGNAGVTLPLESTRVPYERGTLGMPRDNPLDTGGCQLFICSSRAPHLDVRYTAFGKVIDGLDVIDRIDVDDRILHVRVEGAR